MYNFLAISLLIPLTVLYQQIETNFLFQIPSLKLVGLLFLVLGTILLFLALSQYNLSEFIGTEQLRQRDITQQINNLKTSGFNSIVRHPLYFAGLLILWGLFLYRPTDLILMMTTIATSYLYFGTKLEEEKLVEEFKDCLLYTSPSPRDLSTSRMPSSA